MRRRILLATVSMLWITPVELWATTWDEPWRREVVENAATFGLYHVDSVDGRTATVTLVRHLVGEPTPRTFEISMSARANELDAWLGPDSEFYLLLSGTTVDGWRLPTPSSGSDFVQPDGQIRATYRISIHKAVVRAEPYELTQVCIFQVLHGKECELDEVRRFVTETTAQSVARLDAGASAATIEIFFHQHAALETAALLGIEIPNGDFERFFASDFVHVQISALRYLATTLRSTRYAEIAEFVCDKTKHPLSRRFGLLLLEEADARQEADTLKSCIDSDDDQRVPLVRLMDPRIATQFPVNLRKSVDQLLRQWNAL